MRWKWFLGLAVVGAFLFSPDATAVTISSASCTKQSDNELRFDCSISTDDASANGRIRFCDKTVEGTGCTKARTSPTKQGTSMSMTVWNLIPGHEYEWDAFVDSGSSTDVTATSTFTAGTLPTELDKIVVTTTGTPSDTEYVLMNYGCSNASQREDYAIVMDTDGEIVWYEDPRDETSDTTSHITAISQARPITHIQVVVDNDTFIRYARNGDVVKTLERDSGDLEDSNGVDRYIHHDVLYRGGKTYLLTAHDGTWTDVNDCDSDSRTSSFTYIYDGVMVFDSSWTLVDESDIGETWGAAACDHFIAAGGSYWNGTDLAGGVDWVHANSVWVDGSNDWMLSLNHPSYVIQLDGSTHALDWELEGDESGGNDDWDLVASPTLSTDYDFQGQHHAWWTLGGKMMLYDNHWQDSGTDTRAIEIELFPAASKYDITAEWDTGKDCGVTGSVFDYPSSGGIVTMCSKDGPGGPSTSWIGEYNSSGTLLWEAELECDTTSGYAHHSTLYRAEPIEL